MTAPGSEATARWRFRASNESLVVSTNTGDSLCMGFNPDTTGGFMLAPYCETGEFYVQGIEEELRRDAEARQLALDWATGNLGELPGLSLRKLQITYANDRDGLRALESFGEDEFLSSGVRRGAGLVIDVWFFAGIHVPLTSRPGRLCHRCADEPSTTSSRRSAGPICDSGSSVRAVMGGLLGYRKVIRPRCERSRIRSRVAAREKGSRPSDKAAMVVHEEWSALPLGDEPIDGLSGIRTRITRCV